MFFNGDQRARSLGDLAPFAGTPRVANRLLKRVRDFAQVAAKEQIDLEIVKFALEMLHVDERGLDETDHKVLRTMIELYGGGPVGLKHFGCQYR